MKSLKNKYPIICTHHNNIDGVHRPKIIMLNQVYIFKWYRI